MSPGTDRLISFANELWISPATRADWSYFARWHYRSRGIGILRFGTLLWHGEEPIGICLFTSAPLSLAPRNRYFGRSSRWTSATIQAMNRQLVMLSRVVLHPTYRGAGIAARYIHRSCRLCPFPWIETLTQMGHVHPFFEKAGFVRVGTTEAKGHSRRDHSSIYGGYRNRARQPLVTEETFRKSRFAHPVYYIFDNRDRPQAQDDQGREEGCHQARSQVR
ncbi:MAG: hypothetical protein ACF8PG_08815 [Maioricimonas sp. JB045]